MTLFREVTTTTNDDELQVRGGQDHVRVYDPLMYRLLKELLEEVKTMNEQLKLITEEDIK